jgi:cyclohexa-1,5-dienecarbonyl-CoA hydratase
MIRERERFVRSELLEEGRILRVVLDAGKGNVITSAVIAELRAVLARHGAGSQLRGWVLDHAGPHFSFGASVDEHAPGEVERMLPLFHGLVRDIVLFDVPFLACVRGSCLGGGLEIALLAERVFAAPAARFGQPEVRLGVFAPVGSLLLPRLIGPQRAADLLLSGRTIEVEEARAIGLVAQIADDPGRAAETWWREHLLQKSAAALRHGTSILRRELRRWFFSALEEAQQAYLGPLMATHDAREGIAAFLEKRPARWEDR